MVQVRCESLKVEIAALPERIRKEWASVCRFYSSKTDVQVFEDFKNRWDNFKGRTVNEFLSVSDAVYTQWKIWQYKNDYDINFEKDSGSEKSLTEVWNEFKLFWEWDTEESKVMFKEMELLSENMLREWRIKYSFDYPYVYEKDDNHYSCVQRDYRLKSKVQLWDEFKEIWEIDIDNYNEDKYNEMSEYVNEIECDSENYFKDYPRNFFEFRENANYHSFDSYSIIEQFEICEDWESHRENRDSESESESE
jgi:hypothetical protein